MPRRADCRKCRYFKPREQMSDDELEKALVMIEKWRPGEPLLGWCQTYRRPVTYYEGSCFRYTPKPAEPQTRSILEYLRR